MNKITRKKPDYFTIRIIACNTKPNQDKWKRFRLNTKFQIIVGEHSAYYKYQAILRGIKQ